MSHFPSLTRSVLLAVAALLAAGHAVASESLPLSFFASEDVRHDSNFSKNTDQQADTISTTSVGVGLNKDYGRQSYRGSASLGIQRFSHYKELQNDSKDVNGSISSGIASDWLATLGGAYSQNLNPIQNNNTGQRVVRNIRTYADQNLAVQYGVNGRWALVGMVDSNRLSYSVADYQYQNANQNSQGLKVVYSSTDLLNYGVGLRQVKTRYPNQSDQEITDRNLDLSTHWQVTGLSAFDGLVSLRDSSYTQSDRKTKGYTGTLSWSYTPHGLFTYTAALSRGTGADRQQFTYDPTSLVGIVDQLKGVSAHEYNYNTLTTSLNLGANLQATAKLSFGLGYSYNNYKTDTAQNSILTSLATVPDASSNASSHYSAITLSANFDVTRSVSTGCSIAKYQQSADLWHIGFSGNYIDCSVRVTLQ